MLKLIFWIVVGVLALSFFGISIQSIVNSSMGQENINFIWKLVVEGWNIVVQFFKVFVH